MMLSLFLQIEGIIILWIQYLVSACAWSSVPFLKHNENSRRHGRLTIDQRFWDIRSEMWCCSSFDSLLWKFNKMTWCISRAYLKLKKQNNCNYCIFEYNQCLGMSAFTYFAWKLGLKIYFTSLCQCFEFWRQVSINLFAGECHCS